MASERKPGSNRGRPSIDWQQAFQYYASLPAERRDYGQVAKHFGVSVRTVERHGQKEGWRQRACEIDREAAASAASKLVQERAARLADLARLIDGSLVSYAQQLREGRVKMAAADLTRMHKLLRELWDDPASEESAPPPPPAATREDDAAHKLELLRALRDAGAFERLQQLVGAEESEDGE
jgi:hypothetical protein